MHERPAAGNGPRRPTDRHLRGGRHRDQVLRVQGPRDPQDSRLPPGNPHRHPHAAAFLPHRRAPRLQRRLSAKPRQVCHGGIRRVPHIISPFKEEETRMI